MTREDIILSMLDKNKGYVTAKSAQENGIQNYIFQRMAEHGMIERAVRGLYVGADIIPDPFAVAWMFAK